MTKTLYDVARDVCHKFGVPWTDPRTGKTYPPPKKAPKKKAKKQNEMVRQKLERSNEPRLRIDRDAG